MGDFDDRHECLCGGGHTGYGHRNACALVAHHPFA
jgi:hypothetical protein